MDIANKIVVIVGGSQGIGKALAMGFKNEGATVVIASKTQSTLEKTAQEIGIASFVADVRDEPALRNVAESVIEKFGRIDIWINSAGLFMKFPKEDFLDMERAHEMFDVNFFGTVLGSRTALKYLQADGAVINILSSAALDATRSIGAKLYAASKWAVRGYVDALRSENVDNTIMILSVYPGGTKTHLHDEALPADFDNFMPPEHVVEKMLENLKLDEPERDLIIKRPSVQ
jgi:NAD(P)-dependent dehydrogenase (short-subunit alcohol dehydrogenase family)